MPAPSRPHSAKRPQPPQKAPKAKPTPTAKAGAGAVGAAGSAPEKTQAQAAALLAVNWLHTARFWTTAAQLDQLPAHEWPEIAFVGRSNAGKSTCINVLTQQKRLAFASKTPGRTQHINLFNLGKQQRTDAVLADLPGYGYAAVPKEAKYRWQQVMANYLMSRSNLKAIVLLVDSRLGLTELDDLLLDLMRERVQEGLKFLVLLTKADKLNKTEAAKVLSIVQLQAGGGEVRLFSATKRVGVEAVASLLHAWAMAAQPPVVEAEASIAVAVPPADNLG
jgi:GTP-binding protein